MTSHENLIVIIKKKYICSMEGFYRFSLVVCFAAGLGLISCKKEYQVRTCESPSKVECIEDTNVVNVRIINFTNYPLCDLTAKYKTNSEMTYEYGSMEKDAFSCYTAMDYINWFPDIRFNLGTGKFKVADSLITDPKFINFRVTNRGFYSVIVTVAGDLDSQLVQTAVVQEFQ